ncbi:MAG TPA: hypothetical protein VFS67_25940 [Polyangiaceae bacterium]|nr:hypothetical protein [Polyangiaceae bacterium]
MQLLSTAILFATLSAGAVPSFSASGPGSAPRSGAQRISRAPSLPPLPLVPSWSSWLLLEGWAGASGAWLLEPSRALPRSFCLGEVYSQLSALPTLDRMGRFAHIDLAMPGLSAGPELVHLAPEPPREDYLRAQELTPGWSVWYTPGGNRIAFGVATGTRFLLAEQSDAVVDLITSEARLAVFLP